MQKGGFVHEYSRNCRIRSSIIEIQSNFCRTELKFWGDCTFPWDLPSICNTQYEKLSAYHTGSTKYCADTEMKIRTVLRMFSATFPNTL